MQDKKNVLIVEDNPVNLIMTERMLSQLNLNVFSASDGQQAVEFFKSNEIALIFMDCQMPIMDGFAATREIRDIETQNNSHIPIIAMTANAFKEDREKCITAGMDGFLSKPFRMQELLDIINKWLN